MNDDTSQNVGAQIANLVKTLSKNNYRANVSEIEKIVNSFGYEAYRFLLRFLLQDINLNALGPKSQTNDNLKVQLLTQEFAQLVNNPNSVSLLVEALDFIQGSKVEFVQTLSKALSLPLAQQVLIAIALTHFPQFEFDGITLLKSKLAEIKEDGLKTLPDNILQLFLRIVVLHPHFVKERDSVLKEFDSLKYNVRFAPFFLSLQQQAQPLTSQQLLVIGADLERTIPISQILREVGYSCLASEEVFSEILKSRQVELDEKVVAHMIGTMAMSHTNLEDNESAKKSLFNSVNIDYRRLIDGKTFKSWNTDVFVSTITKRNPQLNWKQVILNLGFPGFRLNDQKGLALITSIYRKASAGEPFPIENVIQTLWANSEGQLSFIVLALDAPPDAFNFASPKLRKVSLGPVATLHKSPHWACLDLIETLLNLATDAESLNTIRKVFEQPMKSCPEFLLLGLAEAKPIAALELQRELLFNAITIFVKPHKNSMIVLEQLSQISQTILIGALAETYLKDASSLRRILEIAQQLKLLVPILDFKVLKFSIDLAVLASRRDHLNLELWLSNKINKLRVPFLQETLIYLADNIKALIATAPQERPSLVFNTEIASIFFKCLSPKSIPFAPEISEQVMQLYQRLDSNLQNEMKVGEFFVNPEIEAKANEYFKNIFSQKISVEEAIELLKSLKNSKSIPDQELFACMIFNLFDEYRYFNLYKNPTSLQIVGRLYGMLIQHGIVVGKTLKFALYYVLQSVTDAQNIKMFNFGLCALNEFKTKLPEFPRYCHYLQMIPSFPAIAQNIQDIQYFLKPAPNIDPQQDPSADLEQIHAQLQKNTLQSPVERVSEMSNSALNATTRSSPATISQASLEQPVAQRGLATPPPMSDTPQQPTQKLETPTRERDGSTGGPNLGFQLDISTLLHNANRTVIVEPDQDTKDKIHFNINNLSIQNIDAKCETLKSFIKETHYTYLAYYIVVNRASNQPNFHSVYAKFLEALAIKELERSVLRQTLENIKVLLASDRLCLKVSDERNLLKNLGSWLGHITLARGKPILQRDLDLKALLFDAYENGKLIAIVPFVSKALQHAASSKVFRPPNPWTMGILGLLVELHGVNDLKINLKFEVEVLCQTLNKPLNEVVTRDLLADRTVKIQNNPDIRLPAAKLPVATPKEEKREEIFNLALIQDLPQMLPELPEQVKLSDDVPLFKQYPVLKKLVALALDRSIRECIAPIVKKAVAIGCRTTTELLRKDFTVESDINKLKKAASLMVQSLTTKLAMVTSKDPLKFSIENYLLSFMRAILIDPNNQIALKELEKAAEIAAIDNLDLACVYIERSAQEKALVDIGESLAYDFEKRKRYHQSGGQYGHWSLIPPSRFAQTLPEALYPAKFGLHQHHMTVYEDFGGADKRLDSITPQQALDKIKVCLEEIRKQSLNLDKNSSLFSLPAGEILKQILKIPNIIKQSYPQIETANALLQQTLASIYDVGLENPLMFDIMIAVLRVTKDECKPIVKNLTLLWNQIADQEKKFNVKVFGALLKHQLVMITELDVILFNLLKTPTSHKIFEFAQYLLKKAIIDDKTLTYKSIPLTFEFLSQNASKYPKDYDFENLIEEAKKFKKENSKTAIDKLMQPDQDGAELNALRDKVIAKFHEWVDLSAKQKHLMMNEQMVGDHEPIQASINQQNLQFITQLQKAGLLKTDGDFGKFCRIVMEVCSEAFKYQVSSSYSFEIIDKASPFIFIDAFTELVTLILKYGDTKHKTNLFHKAVIVVTKCLVKEHETNLERFNQRVYLKFFSNLLIDLNQFVPAGSDDELNFLSLLCQYFATIQPANVPGFTFAWLELISHRLFMPKLLMKQKGWQHFHNLLHMLLQFLEPHLRNAELSDPIRLVYRATLKIMLVLLHDFSEFLCDYHSSLCDVIPPVCIQMRNLILSAFPRQMRLPDPFTPNLKVDLLPEINQSPTILFKYSEKIEKIGLKERLDSFLKNRTPTSFINELKLSLLLSGRDAIEHGTRYNIPLINSLVLYIGCYVTNSQTSVRSPLVQSPAMEIFQTLILELDSEGRYLLINALANQLRYPNNHTHYFSCILLYLFAEVRKMERIDLKDGKFESNDEVIQEQITRVLLERLIVNRPHPWGLLITFIELVKNPRYQFWEKKFIRCSPEIERLFENVCRSCIY